MSNNQANDYQLQHHEVSRAGLRYPLNLWAIDMEKPDNVGALFRLADALGIAKIYLVGTSVSPPNKKLTKVARSTESSISWEYLNHPEALKYLAQSTQRSEINLGLELTQKSVDLRSYELDSNNSYHLILGNEIHGVPPEYLQLCDQCLHINMHGQNSSMNVTMAAGIASYQICSQLKPI